MRAYERLLNYVKVYTTSDPVSDTHPTTARQFDLARMLVRSCRTLALRMPMWMSTAMFTPRCPPPRPRSCQGPWIYCPYGYFPDAPGEKCEAPDP